MIRACQENFSPGLPKYPQNLFDRTLFFPILKMTGMNMKPLQNYINREFHGLTGENALNSVRFALTNKESSL